MVLNILIKQLTKKHSEDNLLILNNIKYKWCYENKWF